MAEQLRRDPFAHRDQFRIAVVQSVNEFSASASSSSRCYAQFLNPFSRRKHINVLNNFQLEGNQCKFVTCMVYANKEKSDKENCLLWISGIPIYVSKLLGQSEAASLSENYTAKRTGRHIGFNFCKTKTELSLNQVSYHSTLSEGSTKLARLVENSPRQSANGGVDTSATFLLAVRFWHKFV
ncbi:hypothetical protein T11_9720 [Trichinella zimbabwensis]|uniref:Uncharacterized protein n=1 Tax=Trichinella zimbabwensis TaxID=268475 RepID=A0A0V1HPZ6_9BILA|nr:hypothetical protein T11_9720 [Trichinella zimbabwensis]